MGNNDQTELKLRWRRALVKLGFLCSLAGALFYYLVWLGNRVGFVIGL